MMRSCKIMFTSVGRRVELMQAYRNAADILGIDLELWGADASTSAPALFFCDKAFKVCYISDEQYIPMLLEKCEKEHIDALIPTIDTDLYILSKNASRFDSIGTRVVISEPNKIKLCRDKRLTAEYFAQTGLKTPMPVDDYTKYKGDFPAFIKPKDGSSSINAYRVDTVEDLRALASQVPDYIIQPYIEGVEYTVDAFCDFDGEPIFITPRIRLATRSGEVLKTEISQDKIIIAEMKKFLSVYRPIGAVTIQLIRQSLTGDNYYIEINPRYGGGAPLSMKAGADSAQAMIKLIMGEKLTYVESAARDGEIYSRFDQSICLNPRVKM